MGGMIAQRVGARPNFGGGEISPKLGERGEPFKALGSTERVGAMLESMHELSAQRPQPAHASARRRSVRGRACVALRRGSLAHRSGSRHCTRAHGPAYSEVVLKLSQLTLWSCTRAFRKWWTACLRARSATRGAAPWRHI